MFTPRRRNNDESESESDSLENGFQASSLEQGSPSKQSTEGRRLWFKNKRMICLLAFFLTGIAFVNKQEQQVLDESNYTDARKHYMTQKQTKGKKGGSASKYSTLDHYVRSDTQPSGKFVLKADTEFTPGIAWLMSFPNSGTSFTMTMVARSTNKSFATNYGNEVIAPDEDNSISIYPRRPEGPYWPGYSGKQHTPRDLPDKFVITKTHCGSRCSKCGPDEYIETTEEFLTKCASGHALMKPGSKRRTYDVTYPQERVQRAIHLYRNPMHNLIARYHLEHRHYGYKNDTKWQKDHSNDSEGLHKWCEWTRETYEEEDMKFFGKDKIPNVTCHGEFYKWTQWHNLAHESIELMREGGPNKGPRRDVPVLKVFYEDYNTDFNGTATGILDFLELKQVAPFREFKSRKDYGGYFTTKELVAIKGLVKSVAIEATWNDVQHYFSNVPDEL